MNEQEAFWADKYADAYVAKNSTFDIERGIKAWARMLCRCDLLSSVLECGSNIGRNVECLERILPFAKKSIIEISPLAYQIVTNKHSLHLSSNSSIVDTVFDETFDLVFTMGVLIHIHPDDLLKNIEKIYNLSHRYILVGEYFNRTPISIDYQGEKNKLFKRDFGSLILDNFDLELVDYGFLWGRLYDESGFDDITWWLFCKNSNSFFRPHVSQLKGRV